MRDPLRLIENGKPYAAVPTPTAYAFDATDEAPVPAKNRCSPPAGYKPDKRLDPIEGWYERQGNVFTDLPKATYNPGVASSSTYVSLVAEARVSSNGRVCQEFKSEKGISISCAGGKLSAIGPVPGLADHRSGRLGVCLRRRRSDVRHQHRLAEVGLVQPLP